MNVCIDIQSAITQRAGVGRYTRMLVHHLAKQAGNDNLDLFYFDFQRKGTPFPVDGARQRPVRWIPGRFAQRAWKSLGWPPFDLFSGPADLFHFPNFIRPPVRRGKTVVTIHDVAFLRYPETVEERNLRYLTRLIRSTVEQADAIITVSQFTARECQILLGIPESKCFAIPSGLDNHVSPATPEQIARTKATYRLERPYLLTVGTLEPRKNIPFLLYVFEALDEDIDLVIAGMKGWKFDPILKRMQTSIKRNRIHFLEYVADDELPALYSGAHAFVFPSLYEGFGFPPLEAMHCDIPVLASSSGSLPEVLGDAALLAEPYDVEQWLDSLQRLITDTSLRDSLRQRGHQRTRLYTWDRTAEQTWAVYRSLR
ncbi:MAG TPA: glycosyltransferase family 1 protein [Kiritimatiellia bacterium]|nr:glycosyltransferase family 1 protein [Kiritimatiellia bacterium]